MCESDQHYVCDCPKQICQGCGERGHYITICRKAENAVMAVDMVGRTSTGDDSLVCSEAKVAVYTTLESKTGECLVVMMQEGELRHRGTICGFLTQGLQVTSQV